MTRRHAPHITRACTLAALVASTVVAAPVANAASSGPHTGKCPQRAVHALALGAGATGKAGQAALTAAPKLYKGVNVKGAKIVSAKVATHAGPRGQEVASQCGAAIQARTVVVELRFPKMEPSSSLSEGVVFVSRFKSGYQVWETAH